VKAQNNRNVFFHCLGGQKCCWGGGSRGGSFLSFFGGDVCGSIGVWTQGLQLTRQVCSTWATLHPSFLPLFDFSWLQVGLGCGCISLVFASVVTRPLPCVCLLLIPFIRTLVIRFRTQVDNPGWSHLKILILFLNKVIVTGSGTYKFFFLGGQYQPTKVRSGQIKLNSSIHPNLLNESFHLCFKKICSAPFSWHGDTCRATCVRHSEKNAPQNNHLYTFYLALELVILMLQRLKVIPVSTSGDGKRLVMCWLVPDTVIPLSSVVTAFKYHSCWWAESRRKLWVIQGVTVVQGVDIPE
jgi:hypothetical protein